MKIEGKFNNERRIFEISIVKEDTFSEEEIKTIADLSSYYKTEIKVFCYPEDDGKKWVIKIDCTSTADAICLMDSLISKLQ